ncbi:hypothetical protein KKC44_03860 [Patescibacteria group bacterium]|nr:hypothetical protein [Patescibacteria group bacterium]MBU2259717.1 hypothetical protein [Patescibacteria group bacterium]
MYSKLLSFGLLLTLLLLPANGRSADDSPLPSADLCRAAIDQALAKEQRIYRTVLFGRKEAKDAPVGEVRFDKQGRAFYKRDKYMWVHASNDGNVFYINAMMDNEAELDSVPVDQGGAELSKDTLPRRGILDTKRTMTSELIPYLAQTFRAFACRVDMVCDRIEKSMNQEGNSESVEIPIHVNGCIRVESEEWNSIPVCHFTGEGGAAYKDMADVTQYCQKVGDGLVQRENEILKMMVEYDAAYRSLLQFAGVFDEFLQEFRWTITGSIRKAASIIGSLGRIPCFISSCDEHPPPTTELDYFIGQPSPIYVPDYSPGD